MGKDSVTSTKVKANADKVREVLTRYALQDVQFLIDEAGYLQAVGEEGSRESWPRAVPVTELPKEEDYDDKDQYWDDMHWVYFEGGNEGFTALLQELASCIETPMMILASWKEGWFSNARVWRIEPGSVQVEKLGALDR